MSRMDALGGDAFDNTAGNENTQQQRMGAQPGRDLDQEADRVETRGESADAGMVEGDRGTDAGGGIGHRADMAGTADPQRAGGLEDSGGSSRNRGNTTEPRRIRKAQNLLKKEDDEGNYEDPSAD